MVFGLIVVVLTTSLSVLGLWFLKNSRQFPSLANHQNMASPILSVIGTLFSVLLGFLVAAALTNYENARGKVELEANRLADIFIVARGLDNVERHAIRDKCREYCNAVLDDEWGAMDKARVSERSWRAYYTLWDQVLALNPKNTRESDLHQSLISSMQGLGDTRRSRIANAQATLAPALWLAATAGGCVIVLFTYFLASEGSLVPYVITGLVTTSLGVNICLLSVYSSPFSGEFKIRPQGFLLDRQLFTQGDQSSVIEDLYARMNRPSLSNSSNAQAAEAKQKIDETSPPTTLPPPPPGAILPANTDNPPSVKPGKRKKSRELQTIKIEGLKVGE